MLGSPSLPEANARRPSAGMVCSALGGWTFRRLCVEFCAFATRGLAPPPLGGPVCFGGVRPEKPTPERRGSEQCSLVASEKLESRKAVLLERHGAAPGEEPVVACSICPAGILSHSTSSETTIIPEITC